MSQKIPKVIHYCWFGGKPLPDKYKKYLATWRKYCPDYKIVQWNEKNYDVTKNRYMYDAYQAGAWGFVPDYARLDIIYRYGGFYFDTDVELIKGIDDLRDFPAFVCYQDDKNINFGSGFGAVKGNPIIKEIRDDYEKREFVLEKKIQESSPIINSQKMREMGYRLNDRFSQKDNIVLLPHEYLCPISVIDRRANITKNTYTIHHFSETWLTPYEKFKVNAERLLRRWI